MVLDPTSVLQDLTIIKRLKNLIPWVESDEENAKVDAELLEEEREFWQEQLSEREEELEEVRDQLSEYESKAVDLETLRIALERKGIDTEALISEYRESFNLMLIYPGHQKGPEGERDRFVKKELEDNYGAVDLGGGLKLVPPASVPRIFKAVMILRTGYVKRSIPRLNTDQ